jgi:hypothetical protein
VTTSEKLDSWSDKLTGWHIQLGILWSNGTFRVLERRTAAPLVATSFTSQKRAETALREARARLFAPEVLSKLREELPLNLDTTIGAIGSGFARSHRRSLAEALISAIREASGELDIDIEARTGERQRGHSLAPYKLRLLGHILRIAVAYLGARVLEDKGFFGPERRRPTNDVAQLIREVTARTNGFFRTTRDSSLAVLEGHHASLQKLAKHLGGRQSFALVDDQDVADLYARVLTLLPPEVKLGDEFKDLQQHYTPASIARRMLEQLPIERIPTDERRVFDPAAGSGSLLLEATRRLGTMRDAPNDPAARRMWLASNVLGNDADPRASIITGLRYTLVAETFGETVLYPSPKFLNRDYRRLGPKDFAALPGGRPRILVANPPYAEEGDVQLAANFVKSALSWLQLGDLFAFVLPEAFLAQRTHDVGDARKLLSRQADIFECWQLREGYVGTSARQGVCVLLGAIGRTRYSGTVARKVQTGSELEEVRRMGYLGPSWAASLPEGAGWAEAIDPPLNGTDSSVLSFSSLFDVFCGPTPRRGTRPLRDAAEGERIPYFRLDWQPPNDILLRVSSVQEKERYRLKRDLSRDARGHEPDFARPKLVFHNSTNRNTKKPVKAFLDEHGFWPDHNVHCIVARPNVSLREAPAGWEELDEGSRLLWLLAILRSSTGRSLIEARRTARHTSINTYGKIPLPREVDADLLAAARAWANDPLRATMYLQAIDRAVSRSYGEPVVEIARAGKDPAFREWQSELSKAHRPVRGHVAGVEGNGRVVLSLTGLDGPLTPGIVRMPQELPGWALAGLWFDAVLSSEVRTLAELDARPWALRGFRHPSRDELGSLAHGLSPVAKEPGLLPDGLVTEMQELLSKAERGVLAATERTRLEEIQEEFDQLEENTAQARDAREREVARERHVKRLLDEVARAKGGGAPQ